MRIEKSFLVKDINGYIKVNWRKTLSIIQNEFLLTLIKSQSKFFSGVLLDVGCGSRSYSLLYDQLVENHMELISLNHLIIPRLMLLQVVKTFHLKRNILILYFVLKF